MGLTEGSNGGPCIALPVEGRGEGGGSVIQRDIQSLLCVLVVWYYQL